MGPFVGFVSLTIKGNLSEAPSSLSPRATISIIPFGNGRCSLSASTVSPSHMANSSHCQNDMRFDGDDAEHVVELLLMRFPNGGSWSRFRCPRCHGGAQRLRLLGDTPACRKCLRATGMKYRHEMVSHAGQRTALTAPKRIAMLNGDKPMRVNPRPGRKLDRRALIEMALERSIIVAREFGIAEFEKASRS